MSTPSASERLRNIKTYDRRLIADQIRFELRHISGMRDLTIHDVRKIAEIFADELEYGDFDGT